MVRYNQGHNMMLHTYNLEPMFVPCINFLHLTVSKRQPGQTFPAIRQNAHPRTMGETKHNLIIIIIILGCYIVLFLLLAQSALHSITPARIASLGNLTDCCHARRRSQYPLKLGTHISPGWREAQSRLTSCPRMLSHMKQLASLGI